MDASGNIGSLTVGAGTLIASVWALNVDEANTNNGIAVYPNPSNGQITLVSNKSMNNANIVIYNNLGQEVYKTTINGASQSLQLDLAKGIYNYIIRDNNTVLQRNKLVIE